MQTCVQWLYGKGIAVTTVKLLHDFWHSFADIRARHSKQTNRFYIYIAVSPWFLLMHLQVKCMLWCLFFVFFVCLFVLFWRFQYSPLVCSQLCYCHFHCRVILLLQSMVSKWLHPSVEHWNSLQSDSTTMQPYTPGSTWVAIIKVYPYIGWTLSNIALQVQNTESIIAYTLFVAAFEVESGQHGIIASQGAADWLVCCEITPQQCAWIHLIFHLAISSTPSTTLAHQ